MGVVIALKDGYLAIIIVLLLLFLFFGVCVEL